MAMEQSETVIAPESALPSVVCNLCGEPVPILKPLDELPDNFEESCAKCGHTAEYNLADIVMAEAAKAD